MDSVPSTFSARMGPTPDLHWAEKSQARGGDSFGNSAASKSFWLFLVGICIELTFPDNVN